MLVALNGTWKICCAHRRAQGRSTLTPTPIGRSRSGVAERQRSPGCSCSLGKVASWPVRSALRRSMPHIPHCTERLNRPNRWDFSNQARQGCHTEAAEIAITYRGAAKPADTSIVASHDPKIAPGFRYSAKTLASVQPCVSNPTCQVSRALAAILWDANPTRQSALPVLCINVMNAERQRPHNLSFFTRCACFRRPEIPKRLAYAPGRFISLLIARLQPGTGSCIYPSASHRPPRFAAAGRLCSVTSPAIQEPTEVALDGADRASC